jgi:hypothetical protein
MRDDATLSALEAVCAARLGQVAETFSLAPLERDILLAAAAPELAPASKGPRAIAVGASEWLTARMMFDLVSADGDWSAFRHALRADAPLRHWRLVSLAGDDEPLASRLLSADARIADFLLGSTACGADVARLYLPQSRRSSSDLAEKGVAAIAQFFRNPSAGRRLFFAISGSGPEEMEELAASILARIGMPLLAMDAGNLPAGERMMVLRESLLLRAGVLVHGLPAEDMALIATAAPIVFLTSAAPAARPAALAEHGWMRLDIRPLDAGERMQHWSRELARFHIECDLAVMLAQAPDLTAREISQLVQSAAGYCDGEGRRCTTDDLLDECRARARHRLGELCQRIPAAADWRDIVLPPEVRRRLEELCQQARLQQVVLDEGGFGRHLPRGRGATALFCGASGTGKTLAASIIAHELRREMYRIDLARVVSKYIGETEKNLREIFHEAERARCLLFFDEADAVFGKRTEVRDSHDRFANLEISYLLQLFEEAEHAVVLLASNRRDAIDEAFSRRFRFVIEFPMPNATLRRELWESSFSKALPLDESVRVDVLAERLALSGASIRNIALAAAFLAVSDGEGSLRPITAAQIVHAARREFEKLAGPMPLTAAELSAPRPRPRAAAPYTGALQ